MSHPVLPHRKLLLPIQPFGETDQVEHNEYWGVTTTPVSSDRRALPLQKIVRY
jgi:hypothetical protein